MVANSILGPSLHAHTVGQGTWYALTALRDHAGTRRQLDPVKTVWVLSKEVTRLAMSRSPLSAVPRDGRPMTPDFV
jgi:hypothetical protein